MTDNATFGLRLSGDASGAIRATRSTQAELRRLGQELRETSRRTIAFDGGLRRMLTSALDLRSAFAGITAALSAGALARGIGETLNRLEDIERSAAGLGVSAEAVQELEYTFKQFRLESDDVADALATLSGEAQEIKDGTKKAAEAFDLFGVSVRSLRGKSPDQLFELVADRIRRIEDPTARSARAVAVFGDDLGRKLLPLLIQGGEGLDQYARKAHALGVVLDQDVVTNGGDAAQTFRDIGAQINADFTHAVAENAQAFERLGDALGTIITTGATLTGWFADFGRGLGEATARAMGFTTIEDRIVDLEDQIQARMVTRQRLASTFGANDPRTQQLDAELKKLRELKAAQQSLIDFQPAGKPMRLGAIDVQAKAPAGVSSPSAVQPPPTNSARWMVTSPNWTGTGRITSLKSRKAPARSPRSSRNRSMSPPSCGI